MPLSLIPDVLSPLPPGFVWIEGPLGTWKMTATDPIEVQATLDRERNREFFAAQNAAAEAERERDKVIAQRVKAATATPPKACVCISASPARALLLTVCKWIQHAEQMAAVAATRLASVTNAVQTRDDAASAIAILDRDVLTAFANWVSYGSTDERPDERTAERQRLTGIVDSCTVEAGLHDTAEFELAVADAVTAHLRGELPRLRCDVVVEASASIQDEMDGLVGALSDVVVRACSLGVATGKLPRTATIRVTPTFGERYLVDIVADAGRVKEYQQQLTRLEDDPHATLDGVEPKRSLVRKLLGVQ